MADTVTRAQTSGNDTAARYDLRLPSPLPSLFPETCAFAVRCHEEQCSGCDDEIHRGIGTRRSVVSLHLDGYDKMLAQHGENEAQRLLDACIKAVWYATGEGRGELLYSTNERFLLEFLSVQTAVFALGEMDRRIRAVVGLVGGEMTLRAGIHYGHVSRQSNPCRVARALGDLAGSAETLLSEIALESIPVAIRPHVREVPAWLDADTGRSFPVCAVESVAPLQPLLQKAHSPFRLLRLNYFGHEVHLHPDHPVAYIGRDQRSDVTVGSDQASRQHARIELRDGRFHYVDTSRNGSFIYVNGEPKPRYLQKGDMEMVGTGRIAFGSTLSEHARDCITYEIFD